MSSIGSIAQAIQDTGFFTAIRESGLAYPVIMSTHLSSIAVFGGMILMTDLRDSRAGDERMSPSPTWCGNCGPGSISAS